MLVAEARVGARLMGRGLMAGPVSGWVTTGRALLLDVLRVFGEAHKPVVAGERVRVWPAEARGTVLAAQRSTP